MIIAQISDTHLLPLMDQDPVALKRADNLRRCVSAINELGTGPDAVIHTGDMINFASNNTYELAAEILGQLKAPFFPTVGNRDSRPDFIRTFLSPERLESDAPFCQYRVELAAIDLVAVDTKSDTRRIGTSCLARLQQMETLLRQNEDKPVCLFLHHPPTPVPTLKNPLQFESPEHARGFTDLFDRFDNIRHIFCGHTHRSDSFPIGRHTGSTLPSIATDVRLDTYGDHLMEEPLFQLHEIHEDGQLVTTSMLASDDLFAPACITAAAE